MIPDQVPSPGPNVIGNLPNGGAVPEPDQVTCTACGTIVGPGAHNIVNTKGTFCSMGCAGSSDNTMPEDYVPTTYVP